MDIQSYILSKNYTDQQIEKAEMGDIELDKSLTKEGFAADAKAVGDKFNSIKAPTIDSTLSIEGAAADAKAVGEALKNIDIPEQEVVQADWEQMDETAPDFVKNKPCYVIYQDTDNSSIYVARNFRTPYRESDYYTPLNNLYNSQLCKVIFDGVEYILKNQTYGEWRLALGDATFAEYPFYLTSVNEMDEETRIYSADDTVLHSIQVSEVEANVKTLDPILIPKSIARLENLSSDWEQKDPTAYDYIKNRPFYDNSSSVSMGSQYVHFVSDMSGEGYEPIVIQNMAKIQIKDNDTVIISLNGAKFKCLINMVQHGETDEWGDIIGPVTYTYETAILGFRFEFDNDNYTITITSDKSWYGNISISLEQQDFKQIEAKFLPIKNGDWNQTDSTKPDFIHNKPFYLKTKGQTILEKQEVSFLAEDYSPYYPTSILTETKIHLNNNDKVVIVIDGVEYESVVEERLNEDTWEYDHIAICGDYSFTFRQNYEGIFSVNIEYLQEGEMGGSSHTAVIEICEYDFELKKLDSKFIDSANTVDINDNRPITSATVAEALANINNGGNSSRVGADYFTNDPQDSSYIKNRPFYYNIEQLDSPYSSIKFNFNGDTHYYWGQGYLTEESRQFLVILDDKKYLTEITQEIKLGDAKLINYPFYIYILNNTDMADEIENYYMSVDIQVNSEGAHTLEIYAVNYDVGKKLDSNFINDDIARVDQIPVADLRDNDIDSQNFVKGRTHYRVSDKSESTLTIPCVANGETKYALGNHQFAIDKSYRVSYYGFETSVEAVRKESHDMDAVLDRYGDDCGIVYIHNTIWDSMDPIGTITIQNDNNYIYVTTNITDSNFNYDYVLVHITGVFDTIKKLSNSYISNSIVTADQLPCNESYATIPGAHIFEAGSLTAVEAEVDGNTTLVWSPYSIEYDPMGEYEVSAKDFLLISINGRPKEYLKLEKGDNGFLTCNTTNYDFIIYNGNLSIFYTGNKVPRYKNEQLNIFIDATIAHNIVKQLDEKFIPNTIARITDIQGGSGASAQADWSETDSTNPAYIKNKPFGVIFGEPEINAELSWSLIVDDPEMGTETCSWDMNSINKIGTFESGQYVVSFNGNSAVVDLPETSGTIKTDFIEISYRYDMWGSLTIFTINSDPPTWGSGSSQLVIAPVEIKKLDSIYIDSPQSDWNEMDPDHAGYIQNKPFGEELGEACINMDLEWYSYEQDMDMYYAWSNSIFNVYRYLAPGTYQLIFDNNSANITITNSYSGRIETNFITLEYSWDDMDGCAQFRVVSNAPQIWEYNSAKLTLAPITFTTIDLNYLPNGIADWNEANESKASYIRNRTHWDEQTTEWKQVAYKLGQVSYDDMGEAQYAKFTSVEVNVPIKYNSDYRIVITNSKWSAPDELITNNGTIVHSYDYGMGEYAIVYDGTTYHDNIDTMTFENGITGIAIYERQVIAPMKQLDEKFIPDTIARVSQLPTENAVSVVATHNVNEDSHQDIRTLIMDLSTRLNTVANSTDTDLDQLSELVEYIKDNRELIDTITTAKVSVSDIIDNLETNVSNKPLSAAQGVALKLLINALTDNKLDASELNNAINNALTTAKASGEFNGADGESGVYVGSVKPSDQSVNVWIDPSDDSLEALATKSYVDRAVTNLSPGGGSAPAQMELIASGTNTEPVRRFKITVDNDGVPFELTKMYLVVRNLVSNNTDTNQAISITIQNTTTGLDVSLIAAALMTNEAKNKDVVAYANEDGLFQAFQGGGGIYSLGAPKFSTVFMPNQTFTVVNFTCANALQTFQTGATYELWGVRK